jgi:hypothetical protein
MQIPLAHGAYSDVLGDFRTSYPLNLVPVVKDTGLSNMYLRSMDGLVRFDDGTVSLSGSCRGSHVRKTIPYFVIGSSFISLSSSGHVTVLGTVANDNGPVVMVSGYDRIGILSANRLYYYTDAGVFSQYSGPNLGTPIDLQFFAGYYSLNDGVNNYVTDLNNPNNINAQSFGTDSYNPDALTGQLVFRNELYLGSRFSISIMSNVGAGGGVGYPFQVNVGAQIQKGWISPFGKVQCNQGFAFLGGGRGEQVSVWFSLGLGAADRIATREIEIQLAQYDEATLAAQATLEYRETKENAHLILRLPSSTWLYDFRGSELAREPLWFQLSSSLDGSKPFRGIWSCYAYGRWLLGDLYDGRVGNLDSTRADNYGTPVYSRFDSVALANQGFGLALNTVELSGIFGRTIGHDTPKCSLSWSNDGINFAQKRWMNIGSFGQAAHRLQWRTRNFFRNWRIFRFEMANPSPVSLSALFIDVEPLQW